MDVQQLVNQPRESLSVELKGWLDPDSPEGAAKIVKAAIAMRNHGGGYLLIGFHNDTTEPDLENIPLDVRTLFHVDKIQGTITKYSSEPFEVEIHFPTREGHEFPVIEIAPGVKTPVAAKSSLVTADGRPLITENRVYVRSLVANNTPSTTEATWRDWGRIVEVCFDNREADIGRFLRRHLGGLSPDLVRQLASAITEGIKPVGTVGDALRHYLQDSEDRYQAIINERTLTLPDHGAWEVVLIIVGEVPPHIANRDFLNLLSSSNPNYTGWPVWLDSRGFPDPACRPYLINGTWEAFIVSIDTGWNDQLDFWRLNPSGRFFLRRALQDDIGGGDRAPQPLTALDFGLATIRTAEAIAVSLSFAKAMGCAPERTQLAIGFKWTKLGGRQLSSWVNPARYISPRPNAYQDEVLTEVTVPLDTPFSALGEFVHLATRPLFEVFDGFELSIDVTEDLTQRLLERRL